MPAHVSGAVRAPRRSSLASWFGALAACLLALSACGSDGPTGPGGGGAVVTAGHTIAASSSTTCALGGDQRVYCWGAPSTGAVGNPAVTGDTALPVPIASTRRYAAVFANDQGTLDALQTMCALTVEGAAECWGATAGLLFGPADATPCSAGAGAPPCSRTPRPVATALRFRQLAIGYALICGIANDDSTYCWGLNGIGQLGSTTASESSVPVRVAGSLRFVSLAAGPESVCGVTADGAAYCWGAGGFGQLGDGQRNDSATPVRVQGGAAFAQLAVSRRAVCGATRAGGGACWGSANFWTLAAAQNPSPGRTDPALAPEALALAAGTRQVAFGGAHACAIGSAPGATCWGWNRYGQAGATGRPGCVMLGDDPYCAPATVGADLAFTEIRVSAVHSCARAVDGAVYCWGANHSRQAGGTSSWVVAAPQRIPLP